MDLVMGQRLVQTVKFNPVDHLGNAIIKTVVGFNSIQSQSWWYQLKSSQSYGQ